MHIGSNLFMHVIVTKSPPFENVRGGSNMRLVVRFELTKCNYDCRQSVSMCVVCGILEFDEFHPKQHSFNGTLTYGIVTVCGKQG